MYYKILFTHVVWLLCPNRRYNTSILFFRNKITLLDTSQSCILYNSYPFKLSSTLQKLSWWHLYFGSVQWLDCRNTTYVALWVLDHNLVYMAENSRLSASRCLAREPPLSFIHDVDSSCCQLFATLPVVVVGQQEVGDAASRLVTSTLMWPYHLEQQNNLH